MFNFDKYIEYANYILNIYNEDEDKDLKCDIRHVNHVLSKLILKEHDLLYDEDEMKSWIYYICEEIKVLVKKDKEDLSYKEEDLSAIIVGYIEQRKERFSTFLDKTKDIDLWDILEERYDNNLAKVRQEMENVIIQTDGASYLLKDKYFDTVLDNIIDDILNANFVIPY